MTRKLLIATSTCALLAACALWTVSRASAEPMSESERPTTEAAAASKQSPEVTEALERFKSRDFDGALKYLKEAGKKNPDEAPPCIIMAEWFSRFYNSPKGTRAYLEQAVADQPDDPEAYLLMGVLAIQESRITEARMLYEKANGLLAEFKGSAKRKEKMRPEILSGLATVDEARADWTAAQKHLEAWLQLDPKSGSAMQRLAECLFRQKKVDEALQKLRDAAKVVPDMARPEVILSEYYARSGDQENAKKWVTEAITKDPKNLTTRLVAANRAFMAGKLEEAGDQCDEALNADPNSLDAKVLRGVVALFQKDYAKAEKYFEQATRQAPKNFAPSNNLALALVEQSDEAKKARALEYAEINYRLNPRSAEAVSTYGWVLYKVGKIEEAEKMLNAVVDSGGATADTAYYLARVMVDRGGDLNKAKQLLESALRETRPFSQRTEAKALLRIVAERLKK